MVVDIQPLEELRCFFRANLLRLAQRHEAFLGDSTRVLEVEIEELIGVYSYEGNRVILVVYSGHAVGGSLEGNFEALDVRSFPLDEIPWDGLAFPSTRSAIEDWLKRIETETVS